MPFLRNLFGRRPAPPPSAVPAPESIDPESAPWIDVSSSNLQAVAYYPRARVLLVRFLSGRVYRYDGVPAGVFNGLMAAPSPGKGVYFAAHIRLAYRYRRLV